MVVWFPESLWYQEKVSPSLNAVTNWPSDHFDINSSTCNNSCLALSLPMNTDCIESLPCSFICSIFFSCWIFIFVINSWVYLVWNWISEFFWKKKAGEDATEMIKTTEENKRSAAEKEAEVREVLQNLNSKLLLIGNIVHDSVPISDDEV